MNHRLIFASLFAILAMTAVLVALADQVHALPTPTLFYADNTRYYLWQPSPHRTQVVVVLYGGGMLYSLCPYTYNVYTWGYDYVPGIQQTWVSELYNYGFDVVAIKTGSNFADRECYYAGTVWVKDLINKLHTTYGYSKVSLFGISAGGVIVAYEIEQRTNINGAVFVSSPVNNYPDPLFQSAQNAKNVKTNVMLQWGRGDPDSWPAQMQLYHDNGQSSGHTVSQDNSYSGNLHNDYFTSGAQTQRNTAKSFLWYYS